MARPLSGSQLTYSTSNGNNLRYTRTIHPGVHGDHEEDPRKRGILHRPTCRIYRGHVRKSCPTNIFNGLIIFVMVVAALAALLASHSLTLTAGSDSGNPKPKAFANSSAGTNNISSDDHVNELDCVRMLGQRFINWLSENIYDPSDLPDESLRTYYCRQPMNTKRIFRSINRQVLNQEQALARLERVLSNGRKFKSVALLGPPGVGKTLTALALRQQFPWPENVYSYSWSTYVPDEVRKFNLVRQFVDQLSDCGQNLVIIDNLSTCDYGIVPIYNNLLVEREGERSAAANQSVLVVYIFNLETEHYWEQFELLQQLPVETTIVSFRPFGREELVDCLKSELEIEQRVLDQEQLNRILDETDVYATGCKRLRSLILQYGIPKVN